ncbi:MAG: SDR family NAD(P)-dependent oxidoreductase [Dehalococcoidia bacterium]|nr:SDR family NAD(P)-dependent oxidoreductase [Dehalococcoidia bacterium]
MLRRKTNGTNKKVALVTGALMPRGNGRAIALALAEQGIDVAVTGFTRLEGAQATADEIAKLGRKSIAVRMDGRDYQSVKEAVVWIPLSSKIKAVIWPKRHR